MIFCPDESREDYLIYRDRFVQLNVVNQILCTHSWKNNHGELLMNTDHFYPASQVPVCVCVGFLHVMLTLLLLLSQVISLLELVHLTVNSFFYDAVSGSIVDLSVLASSRSATSWTPTLEPVKFVNVNTYSLPNKLPKLSIYLIKELMLQQLWRFPKKRLASIIIWRNWSRFFIKTFQTWIFLQWCITDLIIFS